MSMGEELDELRDEIASQVARELPRLQGRASEHDSPALATMARLRRGVGVPFGADAEASSELLRLIRFPADQSPVNQHGETTPVGQLLEDAYAVVTLVAFTRVEVRRSDGESGKEWPSFGRDMRRLRREPGKEAAAERLMRILLRSRRSEVDQHLRRAFSLLASEDLGVDAEALVRDLGYWEADAQWVQKRWAFHFWAGQEARSEEDSRIEMTEGVQG